MQTVWRCAEAIVKDVVEMPCAEEGCSWDITYPFPWTTSSSASCHLLLRVPFKSQSCHLTLEQRNSASETYHVVGCGGCTESRLLSSTNDQNAGCAAVDLAEAD